MSGHRWETETKFIDLHSVEDLSQLEDGYVIVEHIYLNIDDKIQYYAKDNQTLPRPFSIPNEWKPLFIYPDEEGNIMVGIWEIQ
jgi:hypothetical protein